MPTVKCLCILLLPCLFVCMVVSAQQKDTTQENGRKKNFNIFGFAVNAFKRTPDTVNQQAVIVNKSEAPYLPFKGKGIRHITIKEFGFDQSFTDTSKKSDYFGTKLLNSLHRNTREWVIHNNLFIKEKTALDPFMVADNERHIRSLEFMQDARILVKPIEGEPDSVDLEVITKDLFSITGELSELSAGKFKGNISDANVRGWGERIRFTALAESNRTPGFGYDIFYSHNNIANTFINASAGYSQIKTNLRDGDPNEHIYFFRLERPLFSQYSHFAGALYYGRTKTVNHYNKPDSLFYNYRFHNYDAWIGYNLNIKNHLNDNSISARQFISLRYFNYHFTEVPKQVGDSLYFRYNNRQAILARFTFFSQKFYKTNYLFGFGTTEDVPYGYNVALTTGWYKQLYLERLYTGIDANKYTVTPAGNVIQYFLRTEGFLRKGKMEDASILAGASLFSKLVEYNNIKLRQYMRFSFTRQFNRVGLDPLGINNTFGIRSFGSDSARGRQRISLHSETYLFLKYKVFGFKFAPFTFADAALLTPAENLFKSGMYYGLGGGVRTRNENFVFNTIEMRFTYFPRKVETRESFKIEINANIRFRYNTTYVRAPDILQLNNDPDNNVF